MSDQWTGNQNQMPWQSPQSSAGVTDVVTQLQNIVRQLTALVQAINGRVISGSFTLGASIITVVPQPAVQSQSTITITPTNLTASNKPIYVSAIVPGTSFSVSTASGTAAAGTETFVYTINTPT